VNYITNPKGSQKMDIVRVLALLNKHILDLETNIQYKEWEIENLRKENEQLKNGIEEKIKKYEKEI
jgi:uncharacterized protein YdcH (DUF465 family)